MGLKRLAFSSREIYDDALTSYPLALDKKKGKESCRMSVGNESYSCKESPCFGEIQTGKKLEARKKEYLRPKGPNDLESLK